MTKVQKDLNKSFRKFVEEDEKQKVWADVIALSFTRFIKHDYNFPEVSDMVKRVGFILKQIENSKGLQEEIIDNIKAVCRETWDDYSTFQNYFSNGDRFGSEWFVGYGTLYRWRAGEKDKAEARVRKYIPMKLWKQIIELQLKLEFMKKDYEIPGFELHNGINKES